MELLEVDAVYKPAITDHPALAWRRAGLFDLTGQPGGPGLMCPAPLASAADGAMVALHALADDPNKLPQNGALLLGERARLMGHMDIHYRA